MADLNRSLILHVAYRTWMPQSERWCATVDGMTIWRSGATREDALKAALVEYLGDDDHESIKELLQTALVRQFETRRSHSPLTEQRLKG